MKTLLTISLLAFISVACTCVSYEDESKSVQYCSTKDMEDINLKYGNADLSVGSADNQAGEAAKEILKNKAFEALTRP